MLNAIRLILRIIGIPLFLIGGIGWFAPLAPLSWGSSDYEMPLGDLIGIAVDSSGDIYCCSQYYSRVQKYNSEGHFLFALQINNGGAVRIRVNQNDQLEVVTTRNDRFYLFTPDGKMVKNKIDIQLFSEIGTQGETECRGPNGSLYKITSSLLFPSVVKILPLGEESTIISVPIQKWFFMGPFPAFLFWVLGLIFLGLSQQKKKVQTT